MKWLSLLLAILPGVLIIIFIYYSDKRHKEPIKLIFATVFCGMVCVVPANVLTGMTEWCLSVVDRTSADPWVFPAINSVFCIALPEELFKFVIFMGITSDKDFDEPIDAIVYAVCVSMGYAIVENIIYILDYGFTDSIYWMFTAVPAHACFAIFMGFFAGRAFFTDVKRKRLWLAISLSSAVVLHGLYEFFIIQKIYPVLSILSLVVLIVSIYFSLLFIKLHNQHGYEKTAA